MENMTFEDPSGNLVSVTYRSVSPAQAQVWLENNNTKNRNLTAANVQKLRRDMTEGRFVFTGDPIRFDKDGNLVDGQHRLNSIAKTGIAQYLLVIEGLDMDAIDRIDQGKVRTAEDILTITGRHLTNASTCISIANLLVYGDPVLTSMMGDRARLADYTWEHGEELEEIASWARPISRSSWQSELFVAGRTDTLSQASRKRAIVSAPVGALALLMIRQGAVESEVKEFFENAASGTAKDEKKLKAAQSVRTYLRTSPLVRPPHIDDLYRTYDSLIRAYNRTRKGEMVKLVKNDAGVRGIRWIKGITPAVDF